MYDYTKLISNDCRMPKISNSEYSGWQMNLHQNVMDALQTLQELIVDPST